jgi:hypothetical protein
MTTSMWSEFMLAPLRASDRSVCGCGRLESARSRGEFVCAWSTCSWSLFVCQQQSRSIGGRVLVYCIPSDFSVRIPANARSNCSTVWVTDFIFHVEIPLSNAKRGALNFGQTFHPKLTFWCSGEICLFFRKTQLLQIDGIGLLCR